jgi:uncharacterized protein YjiS (DUF1127 family)
MTRHGSARLLGWHATATGPSRWHALWRRLAIWVARDRQRRELQELDERLLRDIGIDRIEAMREAARPFWR